MKLAAKCYLTRSTQEAMKYQGWRLRRQIILRNRSDQMSCSIKFTKKNFFGMNPSA